MGVGGLVRHPDSVIDFTSHQADTYNHFCLSAIRNMILADWYDPNHVESYLNTEGMSMQKYNEYLQKTKTVFNVKRLRSLENYYWFAQGNHDTADKRDDMINNLRSACCIGGVAIERMYCTGCHRLFCAKCSPESMWREVEKCDYEHLR